MLDSHIRPWIDPPLRLLARQLVKRGLQANHVTTIGFLIGITGCIAIVFEHYHLALICLALNRIADGLDGTMARVAGPTDLGGYLDIVLDMIFYSAVPFAFALARPEFLLPALFLIYSFIGTCSSFLAYAIIAWKRQITTESHGKKAFFYSVGLMEGTETIVFFITFCVFPNNFAILAWIFGGLCWLTTIQRIATAIVTFRTPQVPS